MYLGIDLGGTNIAVGLVNRKGEVINKSSTSTLSGRPIEEIVEDMSLLCYDVIDKSGCSMGNIEAVGVGCPGTIDSKNGIVVYSNNIIMHNVKLCEMLENKLHKPVSIENDANAAALGEYIVNGNGADSFVCITLGTGVGGGVIINGKLYRGFNCAGGELGHIIIDYTGDVLTQKTFTTDVTTKKKKINTGELPQYYIRNHHVPIVSREQFDAVQIELKRRNCIRKHEKKNEFSKYSGKSALNNLIVCGECGSKYRRTIWIDRRKNKKYVWRCVSRLEYGKKYCKTSPSIDDDMIKSAVIDAINAVYAKRNSVKDIVKCNIAALLGKTNDAVSIEENNSKINSLNERMRGALNKHSTGEITTDELDGICAEIMRESKKLREENQKHKMEIQMKGAEQARLRQIFEAIDHMGEQMTEFDDETVRAVVERIDVMSADRIIIWLAGGISYEKELRKAA